MQRFQTQVSAFFAIATCHYLLYNMQLYNEQPNLLCYALVVNQIKRFNNKLANFAIATCSSIIGHRLPNKMFQKASYFILGFRIVPGLCSLRSAIASTSRSLTLTWRTRTPTAPAPMTSSKSPKRSLKRFLASRLMSCVTFIELRHVY
jgi:hypothetical protein